MPHKEPPTIPPVPAEWVPEGKSVEYSYIDERYDGHWPFFVVRHKWHMDDEPLSIDSESMLCARIAE